MEIRWLEDFTVLARTRHFSRAAEEQNITQPTFSRRIKLLEEEVGVMLIDRDTMPLSLTPAGEIFLCSCESITQLLKNTKEQCTELARVDAEKLRFATTQSLYLSFYRNWITDLNSDIDLKINLKSASWMCNQLVRELEQGQCDLIVCYWSPGIDLFDSLDGDNFESLTVATEKLIPVSACDDNADALFVLPGTGASPLPYIGYNDHTVFQRVINKHMSRMTDSTHLLVVSESAQATSVNAMVAEGFGIGWLPERMLATESNQRLAIAGTESWHIPVEIRVYKALHNHHPQLTKLWHEIGDGARPSAELST